jgi:hypothetical protein
MDLDFFSFPLLLYVRVNLPLTQVQIANSNLPRDCRTRKNARFNPCYQVTRHSTSPVVLSLNLGKILRLSAQERCRKNQFLTGFVRSAMTALTK